jgi:hypothetical protein
MTWGWQQDNLKKLDLQIGIFFSLVGFLIIILTENFILYAMILNFIAFPLFYLFEKRRNIFFREENYKKLRLFLTSGVSGCFLFGFLNFF